MKLLTTGFFDQLNLGQLRFLERVSQRGELHVGVGSDENHMLLKNSTPCLSQHERAEMICALKCVASVILLDGQGHGDFSNAIAKLRPDCFVSSPINDREEKRLICMEERVDYVVDQEADEVSAQPKDCKPYFPYRICLTGGWLDQPWVSRVHSGGVSVLGVEPDREFMLRAGMATSTREMAKRIWTTFPDGDPQSIAKVLFGAENPPGARYVSGSQDALGLCLPGFSTLFYEGDYWPSRVNSMFDREALNWLEGVLWMVPLRARDSKYDPLTEQHVTNEVVGELARSTEMAVSAVATRSTSLLGEALKLTLESWKVMLPLTVPAEFDRVFSQYEKHAGYNLSGCGGGYLIVVSDDPVEQGFKVRVRR